MSPFLYFFCWLTSRLYLPVKPNKWPFTGYYQPEEKELRDIARYSDELGTLAGNCLLEKYPSAENFRWVCRYVPMLREKAWRKFIRLRLTARDLVVFIEDVNHREIWRSGLPLLLTMTCQLEDYLFLMLHGDFSQMNSAVNAFVMCKPTRDQCVVALEALGLTEKQSSTLLWNKLDALFTREELLEMNEEVNFRIKQTISNVRAIRLGCST